MSLHEMVGYWVSEEGNALVRIYVNPHYIKLIMPYGDDKHQVLIDRIEPFIVSNDQIDMRSDEEIARELITQAALHMMPEGDEN